MRKHGIDISFETQRDQLKLDFESNTSSLATSLTGFNITYSGISFNLENNELSKLEKFFKDGTSTSLSLTFKSASLESITINFNRDNNILDPNRPIPSSFLNPADYQTAMDQYVL